MTVVVILYHDCYDYHRSCGYMSAQAYRCAEGRRVATRKCDAHCRHNAIGLTHGTLGDQDVPWHVQGYIVLGLHLYQP